VIRIFKTVAFTLLALLLGGNSSAADGGPENVLDQYFEQVRTTLGQLEDEGTPSRQKLKLRGKLVNGRGYWLQKHGQPGRAVNLVGFFYRKAPVAWSFIPLEGNEKSARITVDFKVESFPGHPWRTEFDLVRISKGWQIRSFKDITRRPLKPGADIKALLDGYLSTAMQAVQDIYSDKLSKEQKQATTMEYGFGAGYWTGQSGNKELPAGTMFTYLASSRPVAWEIGPERVAGAYAEAMVHFTSKPRHGDPIKKSYTFELTRDQGEWFITGHRSQKVKTDAAAPPAPTVTHSGDGPGKQVRTQLELLGRKDATMQQLVKASEPLWLDTGRARRGMGRLIGMAMGMLGTEKSSPGWKYMPVELDGSNAHVIVQAVWPRELKVRVFSRIRFTLEQTAAGWRLADAQILRN
jgi:hypothetical protein